jgi:hypothetical protein
MQETKKIIICTKRNVRTEIIHRKFQYVQQGLSVQGAQRVVVHDS